MFQLSSMPSLQHPSSQCWRSIASPKQARLSRGVKQQQTLTAPTCQLVGVAPDLVHPAVNHVLGAVPRAPRRGAQRTVEHALQRELLRAWGIIRRYC
jgi:hypothetical protein